LRRTGLQVARPNRTLRRQTAKPNPMNHVQAVKPTVTNPFCWGCAKYFLPRHACLRSPRHAVVGQVKVWCSRLPAVPPPRSPVTPPLSLPRLFTPAIRHAITPSAATSHARPRRRHFADAWGTGEHSPLSPDYGSRGEMRLLRARCHAAVFARRCWEARLSACCATRAASARLFYFDDDERRFIYVAYATGKRRSRPCPPRETTPFTVPDPVEPERGPV